MGVRVRLTKPTVFAYDGQVLELPAGYEATGDLAEHMIRNRLPAERVGDGGNDGGGSGGVPDGTREQVLAWVGDNPERARQALAAEAGRDKPRAVLTADLQRITE